MNEWWMDGWTIVKLLHQKNHFWAPDVRLKRQPPYVCNAVNAIYMLEMWEIEDILSE